MEFPEAGWCVGGASGMVGGGHCVCVNTMSKHRIQLYLHDLHPRINPETHLLIPEKRPSHTGTQNPKIEQIENIWQHDPQHLLHVSLSGVLICWFLFWFGGVNTEFPNGSTCILGYVLGYVLFCIGGGAG